MSDRITAKKCKAYLDYLGKIGKFPTTSKFNQKSRNYSKGFFHIQVAYGKPRLVFIHKNTGESDVSPRLPAPQLYMWLQAAGVAGMKARYTELKKMGLNR